jgi:hypothetical protein
MVLTRWTSNIGSLVTPVQANVWLGRFQIPVPSGTSDFNVWTAINADLGAILALRPDLDIIAVAWQVTVSLSVANLPSISAFGGNPARYKLGSATYAQGSFALDYEPINYQLSLLKRQQFIYGEGLPEPSVGVLSLPPIPQAFDYIFTPIGGLVSGAASSTTSYGATRIQFLINSGILGIADVSYTAIGSSGAFIPLTSSVVVSQL